MESCTREALQQRSLHIFISSAHYNQILQNSPRSRAHYLQQPHQQFLRGQHRSPYCRVNFQQQKKKSVVVCLNKNCSSRNWELETKTHPRALCKASLLFGAQNSHAEHFPSKHADQLYNKINGGQISAKKLFQSQSTLEKWILKATDNCSTPERQLSLYTSHTLQLHYC